MKSKFNKFLKSIIVSVALVFGISLFAVANVGAKSHAFDASEYSPISKFSEQQSLQTTDLIIADIASSGSSSKTISLYTSSDDSVNFSYFVSDEVNYGASQLTITYGADGIFHKVKSPTSWHEQNAQFISVVQLSNNMVIAMDKGYVSVSASAYAWSPDCGYVDSYIAGKYYDYKDNITTQIYAYNTNTQKSVGAKSNSVKTFGQSEGFHQLSYSASELANASNNRIAMTFKSDAQGGSSWYNSDLFAYTSLKIVSPQITFSTTDTTRPTMSGFENVPTNWVQSRTIPLSFADAESGLFKIEMQKNDGEWVEIANFAEYTTAYDYDLLVEENNSYYKFKITDNVGNVYEMTEAFVEENIDTVAPSVEVSLAESFGVKQIDFSSVPVVSQLSADSFAYTLKDASNNVVSSGTLADAHSIAVDGDGEYTLEVSGIDEAGNTFAWSGTTTVARTQVVPNITGEYTYSLHGFELEYSVNVEGEYDIVWSYYLADGVTSADGNVGDVGTYVVKYSVDAFAFSGTGSKEIIIEPKVVELGTVSTSYIYGETFRYTLLDQEDAAANLVVTFSQNDAPATFENVGTYTYTFAVQNTNFAIAETVGEATISPKVVTATVSNQTAVYDKTAKFLTVVLSENLEFNCEYSLGGELVSGPTIVGDYQAVISLKEANPNYSFEEVTTTLSITPATLYVFADESQMKVYGETDPTLSYVVYGLCDGDAVSGTLSRETGENVGYYNITIGSLSADNYTISYTGSVFEIEKKALILIAQDSSKTYGEADPVFGFNQTVANILDADKSAFMQDNVMIRTAGESVGRYVISFNQELIAVAPFSNYKILSTTARFVVVKANLEIVANDVETPYGTAVELSYQANGVKFNDNLEIVLSRESGNTVGEYQISLQSGNFANYNVSFVGATYKIIPKAIQVVANNVSKVYGTGDELSCTVVGAIDENVVVVNRQTGEAVGTYAIDEYVLLNNNYTVESFEAGVMQITKAAVSVEILSASKVYGEVDPSFDAVVSGLVFDDVLSLSFVREAGENAGSYQIDLAETEFSNYEVAEITAANLVIKKATPVIVIGDADYVYNAKPIVYAAETGFEVSYQFYFAGSEIDAPTNAGEYSVVAYFAGNENYNEAYSNEANVVIDKKFIPITLKKLDFLYNGLGQVPEYEIGLDVNVSVITIFEGVKMPVEVGEYKFSMVSNDPNYYASTTGTLKIVEVLYVEDTNNSASVSSSSVSATNASISILNNTSSSLLTKFNPLFDGRKCVAVYEFANAGAKTNGEVFTVKIKAVDTENPVEIYAVSANGELVKTAYSLVDGYYVFSLNSLSNQIMVTTTNNMMFYARIVAVVTVLLTCIIFTKGVNRRRKNHFLKRNTSVKKYSHDEVHENIGIVNDRVDAVDRISPESFVNIKR